ncbi:MULTISPECIES: M23 family metallopeptidase [unclassified Curtobacterium]|uniref:M23 family metallopeptidase n=1 Tax=unclassified Curtobacterium TaxID=257496 RepID=UPI0038288E6B
MTTNPGLPVRPRGAARDAANRAAALAAASTPASQSPGATVSTPVAPEPTPVPAVLPSRRSLRPSRPSRPDPVATGVLLARMATAPVRALGDAVHSARAVPVTATAVAACLFVTVATPQPASASPVGVSAVAFDMQEFTVPDAARLEAVRDGFSVGRTAAAAAPVGSTSVPAVRPVAGSIPTAGGFGARWVRGCGACSTDHQGLDFAAPTGTAVVAAMSGRVVSAGVFGGYGEQVLLQHGDGTQTRYGHLSRIDVRVGQSLAAGEQLGAVGSTGVSTGSHLHFEVVIGGRPVDPATWLGARGLL